METYQAAIDDFTQAIKRSHSLGTLIEWKLDEVTAKLLIFEGILIRFPLAGDINWMETV